MYRPLNIYAVNLWLSFPGKEDGCITGIDVPTKGAALALMRNPEKSFSFVSLSQAAFVEVDGPDIYMTRRLISEEEEVRRKEAETFYERACLSEIATQAGMSGGCSAYNEVMGYDLDVE